jgi:hypothetical protein
VKYLAISKETTFFAYAVFEDETLSSVDFIQLTEFDDVLRIKQIYHFICALIEEHKPSVVVTHDVKIQKVLKKDLEKICDMRISIKLACLENKVLYLEARTYGWEKYIVGGNVTNKKKTEILKNGYGINFTGWGALYGNEMADAIILGEAIAHKRIHV